MFDRISVDMGVITAPRKFVRTFEIANTSGGLWVVRGVSTSCGCLSVIDYPDHVSDGEVFSVRVEVRPSGMMGKKSQAIRADLGPHRQILWKVSGVFAAEPFLEESLVEVSLGPAATEFDTGLVLYALPKDGDPIFASPTSLGDVSGSLRVVEQGPTADGSGLIRYAVAAKGAVGEAESSSRLRFGVSFSKSKCRVHGEVLLTRQTWVTVSPSTLVLPQGFGRLARALISYKCRPGVTIHRVRMTGDASTQIEAELSADGIVVLRLEEAALLEGGHGEIVLQLSNGTNTRLPVCILGS